VQRGQDKENESRMQVKKPHPQGKTNLGCHRLGNQFRFSQMLRETSREEKDGRKQ
jgi:hypothetical protein